MHFPAWLQSRLLSGGLEPVISQTEKSLQHRVTDNFLFISNENHKTNNSFSLTR